jgi:hypothetical protein
MKQRSDENGYRMVGRGLKVHRLVASTFIPNPNGHPWVAHNDGNPANNRVENLRWDSISANHLDKRRHGTAQAGEKHAFHKLTKAQVRDARRRARGGETHASIAKDMPVCRSVLSRVIRGEHWQHV